MSPEGTRVTPWTGRGRGQRSVAAERPGLSAPAHRVLGNEPRLRCALARMGRVKVAKGRRDAFPGCHCFRCGLLVYRCVDTICLLEKMKRVIRKERVCVSFLRNAESTPALGY